MSQFLDKANNFVGRKIVYVEKQDAELTDVHFKKKIVYVEKPDAELTDVHFKKKIVYVEKPDAELTDVHFKKLGSGPVEYLGKISYVEKPEAELTDVHFKKLGSGPVEYLGQVSVTNPYDHCIPIREISYTLKSCGRVIVSGTIPNPGSIEEGYVTVLQVPMKVPHTILITLAKDVGADGDIDYEMIIRLTIDLPIIGNFTFPLSKKGEFRLLSVF